MKKVFLILATIVLSSCSGTFNDNEVKSFDNTEHWTIRCMEDTTEAEVMAHAKQNARPSKTTYFYYFDKDVEIKTIAYAESADNVYKVLEPKPALVVAVVPNEPPFIVPQNQFYAGK